MNQDIIVLADKQVDNNSPTEHIEAISRYIWKHKPAHLVDIGDHWDFPSLSHYATQLEREGRRLIDDLNGGFDAFKLIMKETEKRNKRVVSRYRPEKHFVMGNHENRLVRFLQAQPALVGCFDLQRFIENEGWEFHNFLEPAWINEIAFIHYLPNPQSSRPIGGSIENKLNKIMHSFVHGHQQQFQYGRRQNLLGKPHFGACAGSFYMHDEGYRGANNTEIRGFIHLRSFENRYGFLDYDLEFVSLERLLQQY